MASPCRGEAESGRDAVLQPISSRACRRRRRPPKTTGCRDPVCGMRVDRASRPAEPARGASYLLLRGLPCEVRGRSGALPRRPARARADGTGVHYTCPMHPEIVRDAPGDCPICGMALEPMLPTATTGPNPELVDLRRRLWIGAPLAAGGDGAGDGGAPRAAGRGCARAPRRGAGAVRAGDARWCSGSAAPFFRRGWASIVNRSPNMWTLIALGTGAAYLFSLVATFAPGAVPARARRRARGAAGLLRGGGGHPRSWCWSGR